jgi:hypothetical protein
MPKNKVDFLGYIVTTSNPKIGSKGAPTIDFVSRFVMIIESANLDLEIC